MHPSDILEVDGSIPRCIKQKVLNLRFFCSAAHKSWSQDNGLGRDIIAYPWPPHGVSIGLLAACRTSTRRIQYIHTNTYIHVLVQDQAIELVDLVPVVIRPLYCQTRLKALIAH